MAKQGKSFSLSQAAIDKILAVQKEKNLESESAALEYMLLYQMNEVNIKEVVYETMIKILTENSISFNGGNVKSEVKEQVTDEVQKAIKDATDNIFDNMPE